MTPIKMFDIVGLKKVLKVEVLSTFILKKKVSANTVSVDMG